MKRGEESACIKITLRGDGKDEDITVIRKINTSNKSEWLFNGRFHFSILFFLCMLLISLNTIILLT